MIGAAQPSATDVLRERAEARATLVANGLMDLQGAVDELQAAAVRTGLVDDLGQNAVQGIISQAFARWR
jgi:hypothetical protein